MLSLPFQRRSIQNNNPATRPSRLMSMTLCRDGCGWRTCLQHVLLLAYRAEARPTSLGCRGPFHDTNRALRLRHGVGRDAPVGALGRDGVPRDASCAGLPSAAFLSTKVHEGHEEGMRLHHCCTDMPPAYPLCPRVRHGARVLRISRDAPVLCVGLKPRGDE
jgi:hypothetical protein